MTSVRLSGPLRVWLLACVLISAPLISGWARAPVAWPIIETSSQWQCVWLARNPTVRIFDNNAQWQSILSSEQKPAFTPDWQRHAVIALTLGARPSSGYAIELAGKAFELRNDTLWLNFRERTPAAGEIHSQALTQPCIFILVERGKWRHVALGNAESGVTFQADLTH